jgi:hypothetical protein
MKSYLKIDYLCEDVAIIHANICGDGCLYCRLEKRSPSNIRKGFKNPFFRYTVDYTNTSQDLLDRFEKIIRRIAPSVYIYRDKQRIQVRNKQLFELIKRLGAGKSLEWSIPKEIITNPNLRKVWLGAFFDDEGTITSSAIIYYSSNKKALEDVKTMLELERIECTFYSRYFKNSVNLGYVLRIRNRFHRIFIEKIPFIHPNKKIAYEKYWLNKKSASAEIRTRAPGLEGQSHNH